MLTPEGQPAAEPDPDLAGSEPRRYPSTLGGLIYIAVMILAVGGLAIVALASWRLGVAWMGICLLLAACARGALPDQHAGMLQVRHRYLDAALLTAVGIAMVLLAYSIPNQPG